MPAMWTEMKYWMVVACLVAWGAVGCRAAPSQDPGPDADGAPSRPAGLPDAAFWLGGPDGGVFVRLKPRAPGHPQAPFQGTVFYENGDTWMTGNFIPEPPGAAIDVTNTADFIGWDGERLLLNGGRSLRAMADPPPTDRGDKPLQPPVR